MSDSLSGSCSFDVNQRHPLTAALLSVVPGLGQLYNGDRRKGFLFLDVSAVNFILLWLMLFTEPLIKALNAFSATFHCRANDVVIQCLQHTHIGSPASLIMLLLICAFACYASRDAYDRAWKDRRGQIYPGFVLELSEATSGSYLLHFALMGALAVLAMFFIIPRPVVSESVDIQFVDTTQKKVLPQETKTASRHDSVAHGHRDLRRPTMNSTAASKAQATSPSQPSHESQAVSLQPKPVNPLKNPPAPQPQPQPAKMQTVAAVAPPPLAARSLQAAASNAAPAPPVPLRALPQSAAPVQAQAPSARAGRSAAAPLPLPRAAAPVAGLAGVPGPVISQAHAAWSGVPLPSPGRPQALAFAPAAQGPVGIQPAQSPAAGIPAPVTASRATSYTGPDGSQKGLPGPAPVKSKEPGHGTPGDSGFSVQPRLKGGGEPGSHARQTGNSPQADGKVPGTNAPGEGINPLKDTDDGIPDNKARQVDFSRYMTELQRRIKRHWFPIHGKDSKRVVVIFNIHRDGSLGDLRLSRSSGSREDDKAALDAVQAASPFMALPENSPESVDIEFTFDYNVFGGGNGARGSFRQF